MRRDEMNGVRRRAVVKLVSCGGLAALTGCNKLLEGVTSYTDTDTDTDPGEVDPKETARLVAADGDTEDRFGWDVALADGTTLVGTPFDEDPNGRRSGAAYVFETVDGGWSQGAKLAAPDGDERDRFGKSVSITGTTALVGAPHDEDPNGANAGAAYVFSRNPRGWSHQAKLVPATGDSGDTVGHAVALADSTAILGSPTSAEPVGLYGGGAHVFDGSDGHWKQSTTLAPTDGVEHGAFGAAVELSAPGDTVIVGAPGTYDPAGDAAGRSYVFNRTSNGWTQQATLSPGDGQSGAEFGRSVAIGGDTAIVGAPKAAGPAGDVTGAAYVFDRTPDGWTTGATLRAASAKADDRFGRTVAMDGNIALIGAHGADQSNAENSGATYVFAHGNEEGWTEAATLTPSDGQPNDRFGWAVALSGLTAMSASPAADTQTGSEENSGAVYTFHLR